MTRIRLADLNESGAKICQNLHQPLRSFRRIGLELAEKGGNENTWIFGCRILMRKDRKGITIGQRTWSRCNTGFVPSFRQGHLKTNSKKNRAEDEQDEEEQQRGRAQSNKEEGEQRRWRRTTKEESNVRRTGKN